MKGVSIFLLLTCNLVGICFGGNKDAEFEHAMVNGASVCIRLRVVGDDGEAVGDAKVNVLLGMNFRERANHVTGFTSADGEFVIKGITTGNEIEIQVSKDGYYRSNDALCLITRQGNAKVRDGKWQPWGEERKIRLRKIKNPIYLIRHEKTMYIPETNVWMGLDLSCGDWTEPFGKGKESDIEVRVLWDGKSPEYSRYCKTEARFVKPMSGFYELRNVMESKMPYPYEANSNATYGLNFEYYDRKNGAKMRTELLPNDNRVLRVRCEITKDGRLRCANYCGLRCLEASPGMAGEKAVLGLECVFNPTPNDTNLEDMDIAQRTYKQIELEKRLEKERREKEAKTVWGGIKKMFGAP